MLRKEVVYWVRFVIHTEDNCSREYTSKVPFIGEDADLIKIVKEAYSEIYAQVAKIVTATGPFVTFQWGTEFFAYNMSKIRNIVIQVAPAFLARFPDVEIDELVG